MATITLTDRISVRVTAKDSAESSAQKKRDGGNTAAALGSTGLTDSEKEELGDDLGETLTGEDGRTYARSDKVAGVLKKLKEDGALDEETTVYKYGNVGVVSVGSLPEVEGLVYSHTSGSKWFGPVAIGQKDGINVKLCVGDMTYYPDKSFLNNLMIGITRCNKSPSVDSYTLLFKYIGDSIASNNAKKFGLRTFTDSGTYNYYGTDFDVSSNNPAGSFAIANDNFFSKGLNNISSSLVPITLVGQEMLSLTAYGDLHEETTGGPKVDPTGKTDAQIQKDLEDFAALNNCKMTSDSGDTYIAVTDANGNPLYFLGT